MGTTAILQGGPGSGQHTKMANQIAIAGSLAGTVEALSYAKGAGLDPRNVPPKHRLGLRGKLAAQQHGAQDARRGFRAGLLRQALPQGPRIALDSARAMKLDLPLLVPRRKALRIDAGRGLRRQGDPGPLPPVRAPSPRRGRKLKRRGFEPSPETVVEKGAFALGRYGTPFRRANMLDVSHPFHYPVPRMLKNWRLKEWQAYQFGDKRWFFFATLYNAKDLQPSPFPRLRPRAQEALPDTTLPPGQHLPLLRIAVGLARLLPGGANPPRVGLRLRYWHRCRLTVVRGSRSAGRRFSGRFRFACGPKVASPNVVCLPLGLNRAMYSTKILMPMEGEFSVGGESHRFEGPSSMGIIDDQKATTRIGCATTGSRASGPTRRDAESDST